MPALPIRWLHISDLHFDAVDGWERSALLTALLRHLEEFTTDHPIDLVCVTGDIANRGRRGEYDQALRFIKKLCDVLRLDPATHLFLVPGNHDIDRGRITRASAAILGALDDETAISETFADEPTMHLLGARLTDFYDFTGRLLGPARAWRPERPWRVDTLDVRGTTLALLQLNSAWASGTSDDRGRLLVGEPQLRAALDESARATLRLALLHHPVEDLHDVDRDRIGALLTAPGGPEFVLRGHLHADRFEVVRTPDAAALQIAAGAAYTHDRWPKTINIVELDLPRGEGRVRWFRYSDRGRGFWTPDTTTYENARDGTWTFPLPAAISRPTPIATPSTDALQSLVTRLRTVTAAVYGTVRFIGLADRSPKPNVRVEDVFVPLSVQANRVVHERLRLKRSTAELIPLLACKDAARVVVLGDPGSGKTTLCRYLAVALSRGLSDTLALYLPFREYIAAVADGGGDLSIVTYLARVTTTHLSLPLQVDELERLLERGDTVLLLDGLDEVGDPEARVRMRDRVLAFSCRYPCVSMLVTSRIAGYDDAPLPETDPQPFTGFTVQPLSAAAIEQFVTRWYAIQEPTDPIARERGQTDLIAALRAEPAAQALARNPLLLTLIALIHRSEARLPGERARLFEKCVTTLLETWPKVRRREFHDLTLTAQRAALEGIAWHMQERRVAHKTTGQVLLARPRLAVLARNVLVRRGFFRHDDREAPRVVDAWLDHLARETGLLVEQVPGKYAFLHLTLMEYLTACELDRIGPPGPVAWILAFRESAWDEVCLLSVGRNAEEPLFLRALADAMAEHGHWEFLLRCLREEACLDPAVVDRVLDEAKSQSILKDILRFSRRHAARALAWFHAAVHRASESTLLDLLRLAVAVALPHKEVIHALAQRDDPDATARTILGDCWPITSSFPDGDCVGWAWRRLALAPALEWSTRLGWSDITPAAVLAHAAGACSAEPALSVALARAALQFVAHALDTDELPGVHVEPGGHPMFGRVHRPLLVDIEPVSEPTLLGRKHIETGHPIADFLRELPDAAALIEGYAGGTWLGLADCPGWQFISYFGPESHIDIAEQVRAQSPTHYDRWYGANNNDDDDDNNNDEDTSEWLGLGNYTPEKFVVEDIEQLIREQFKTTDIPCPPLAPPDHPDTPTFDLLPRLRAGTLEWTHALLEAMALHTGQSLLAQRLAARAPALPLEHTGELLQARLWLLVHWSAIDTDLPADPTPGQLALYLALGWTQCTTTSRWPDSPRWRDLLGGQPPAHWLPRAHWHLCWLTFDPAAAAHRHALDLALDAGLADPELREVAVHLRSFIPRPGAD